MKLGFLQRGDLQESTTLKLEMRSVDSHDVAVHTYCSLQNTRVRLDRSTNPHTFKVDPKFRVLGASCTRGREAVVAQQDIYDALLLPRALTGASTPIYRFNASYQAAVDRLHVHVEIRNAQDMLRVSMGSRVPRWYDTPECPMRATKTM